MLLGSMSIPSTVCDTVVHLVQREVNFCEPVYSTASSRLKTPVPNLFPRISIVKEKLMLGGGLPASQAFLFVVWKCNGNGKTGLRSNSLLNGFRGVLMLCCLGF